MLAVSSRKSYPSSSRIERAFRRVSYASTPFHGLPKRNNIFKGLLMIQTKLQVFGQLALCKGCCCGKTERGLPAVPVDRIKAVWKMEKLNQSIQLTISGCLGPCDVPNVALILTPSEQRWFARLETDSHYDLLIEWARSCHRAGKLQPVPELLESHRLCRYADEILLPPTDGE